MPGGLPNPSGTLAGILADMIRSAVAWERDHGLPKELGGEADGVTGIPLRIHYFLPDGKPLKGKAEWEDEDDS